MKCPRCAAEVLIPAPGAEPSDLSDREATDEGVSLEILEIRPEDIRAEGVAPRRAPHGPTAEGPGRETPPQARRLSTSVEEPSPGRAIDLDAVAEAGDEHEHEPTVLPAIRVDDGPPSRSVPRTPPARPNDLVLPRAVVAAWSMLVLLAVGFAFVAGLLSGHYLWKVH